MTSTQVLDAIKNRTVGWQNLLQTKGRVLDNHEKWVAQVLSQSPPGQSDSTETRTGTALGALSLEKAISNIVTTGAATASLANGYEGQFKTVLLQTAGGNLVLTPASLQGGTTLTFDAANDLVVLQFVTGKWRVVTNTSVALA